MNFNDQLETLGHCLNVRIFEITSVRIRANVDVAQFSEQRYLRSLLLLSPRLLG